MKRLTCFNFVTFLITPLYSKEAPVIFREMKKAADSQGRKPHVEHL